MKGQWLLADSRAVMVVWKVGAVTVLAADRENAER